MLGTAFNARFWRQLAPRAASAPTEALQSILRSERTGKLFWAAYTARNPIPVPRARPVPQGVTLTRRAHADLLLLEKTGRALDHIDDRTVEEELAAGAVSGIWHRLAAA
jgi:hypothetical protein